MSIIVQKFGGTSVANSAKIQAAASRAVAARRSGHQVVVVVSARGKKTDELVALAKEMSDHPSPREMDMLLSTGEQESVALMAMAIQQMGEPAVSLTGAQIGIVTNSSHTKARIQEISTTRIRALLQEGAIVVACGFQGVDEDFNITTLGRGGSDTTATALAAVLQAESCDIYTDVEGVFTTDPRLVRSARKIDRISYDEMLELASAGAGVMHSRSIEFAKKYRVPLRVRPSYSDEQGTLITVEPTTGARVVTGVALVRDECRVSLCDIPDQPGVMSLILTKMSEHQIPVDMVVQDVATEGLARVSFTVPQDELAETLTAASQAILAVGSGRVEQGTNVSKVSVVGAGMRSHTGVAAEMFRALSEADINIQMITTSEIKISVLVDREKCDAAVQVTHEVFGLSQPFTSGLSVGFDHRPTDVAVSAPREELEREVVAQLASMEGIVVSEIQLDSNQARVTVSQLPDRPGVVAAIFAAVAEGGVMVDMIVQNVSQSGQAHLSFTILRDDLEQCLLLTREVLEAFPGAEISYSDHIAKLTVNGIGLRSHVGVGQKMFRALAEASINVKLVNTSEMRISAVVDRSQGTAAHNALLQAFNLPAAG